MFWIDDLLLESLLRFANAYNSQNVLLHSGRGGFGFQISCLALWILLYCPSFQQVSVRLVINNFHCKNKYFFLVLFLIFACCSPLGFSAGSIYHGLQSRPRRHYSDPPDQMVNTSGTVPSIHISTRNYYTLSYCCRYCFYILLIHQ